MNHNSGMAADRGQWSYGLLPLALIVVALVVLRILVAIALPLHGDEAFYRLESFYPAWFYSDLPPLQAWALWLSRDLFGDEPIALRSLTLVAGAVVVPWLIYRIAVTLHSERGAGLAAATFSLTLPLATLQGTFALPDIWITVFGLLLVTEMVRSSSGVRPLATGLIIALGLLTHYRFGLVIMAAGLWMLLERRAWLRKSTIYWAGLLGSIGLVPAVAFNLQHEFSGIAFQVAERHPWEFSWSGLRWIPLQAASVTPFLFIALLALGFRRITDPAARFGLIFLGLTFAFGFWTDRDRLSLHWPFLGWIVLCVPLGVSAVRWKPWQAAVLWLAAMLPTLALTGLILAAQWRPHLQRAVDDILPGNLYGWDQLAASVDAEPGQIVVADNFMAMAELAHQEKTLAVQTLKHPLNDKHGRATQLAIWGLDNGEEAADKSGWLIVEETALKLQNRLNWARYVCATFPNALWQEDVMTFGERNRFRVFRLQGGKCDLPAIAYLDQPRPGSRVASPVTVAGWAFDDDMGIASIQVIVDGKVHSEAQYGLSEPGVGELFPASTDAAHPDVGFTATVALPPGAHTLAVELRSRDGTSRRLRSVPITVLPD